MFTVCGRCIIYKSVLFKEEMSHGLIGNSSHPFSTETLYSASNYPHNLVWVWLHCLVWPKQNLMTFTSFWPSLPLVKCQRQILTVNRCSSVISKNRCLLNSRGAFVLPGFGHFGYTPTDHGNIHLKRSVPPFFSVYRRHVCFRFSLFGHGLWDEQKHLSSSRSMTREPFQLLTVVLKWPVLRESVVVFSKIIVTTHTKYYTIIATIYPNTNNHTHHWQLVRISIKRKYFLLRRSTAQRVTKSYLKSFSYTLLFCWIFFP